MFEYIKKDYGKHGTRMNPNYPPHHVYTACKCDICGEYYEADRLHICKTQNSYPDIDDAPTIIPAEDNTDFFTKGHLHLGYVEGKR